MKMKHSYIYRITDRNTDSLSGSERYIYASNKPSAKRWQLEHCPEIKASIECIGEKKAPIASHAEEFTPIEYEAIRQRLSDMTNPAFWKEFNIPQ